VSKLRRPFPLVKLDSVDRVAERQALLVRRDKRKTVAVDARRTNERGSGSGSGSGYYEEETTEASSQQVGRVGDSPDEDSPWAEKARNVGEHHPRFFLALESVMKAKLHTDHVKETLNVYWLEDVGDGGLTRARKGGSARLVAEPERVLTVKQSAAKKAA
jgi:hypothetical protein